MLTKVNTIAGKHTVIPCLRPDQLLDMTVYLSSNSRPQGTLLWQVSSVPLARKDYMQHKLVNLTADDFSEVRSRSLP